MAIVALKKKKRPSKEQRIETIVDAARHVFCLRGFEKASVASIAETAGVAEGTIYTYFEGKRELLYEVLKRHYSVIFEEIDRTLPVIQGHANRLRFLIMRALHAIAGDRAMCRLITCELRQAGESDQSVVHDLNRHYAELLVQVLKEGKADGTFRADTSVYIVRDLICGGLELTAWSYMLTGRQIDVEAVTESVARTVLGGVETDTHEYVSLHALVKRLEHVAAKLDA